jgi:hypothetical protein
MKLAWGFWFFCIGLLLSIPIQLGIAAVWSLATNMNLICHAVGGGPHPCSLPNFIEDRGYWIVFKIMSAPFVYGLINLGIALTAALLGLFLMKKSKLVEKL